MTNKWPSIVLPQPRVTACFDGPRQGFHVGLNQLLLHVFSAGSIKGRSSLGGVQRRRAARLHALIAICGVVHDFVLCLLFRQASSFWG